MMVAFTRYDHVGDRVCRGSVAVMNDCFVSAEPITFRASPLAGEAVSGA